MNKLLISKRPSYLAHRTCHSRGFLGCAQLCWERKPAASRGFTVPNTTITLVWLFLYCTSANSNLTCVTFKAPSLAVGAVWQRQDTFFFFACIFRFLKHQHLSTSSFHVLFFKYKTIYKIFWLDFLKTFFIYSMTFLLNISFFSILTSYFSTFQFNIFGTFFQRPFRRNHFFKFHDIVWPDIFLAFFLMSCVWTFSKHFST